MKLIFDSFNIFITYTLILKIFIEFFPCAHTVPIWRFKYFYNCYFYRLVIVVHTVVIFIKDPKQGGDWDSSAALTIFLVC